MKKLPDRFADLEPFVAEWALSNERDRFVHQMATSIEALRAFYDAMAPRAEEIADYLKGFDLAALPDGERTLFYLLITFVECAHPIELNWRTTDIDDAFPPERMGFGEASCKPQI